MTVTNEPWKRVVLPGYWRPEWYKVDRLVPVFVEIDWQFDRNRKWELSLSGVEGPLATGNCVGGCGQIDMHGALKLRALADGWTREMVARLRQIWDRWHLNGMRAGSPAQETFLRSCAAKFPGYPASHLDWARNLLAEAGLEPDPDFYHPTKRRDRVLVTAGYPSEIIHTPVADVPYSYGSAWIYEDVPADVLEWLYNLPPAEKPHAWGDHDQLIKEA